MSAPDAKRPRTRSSLSRPRSGQNAPPSSSSSEGSSSSSSRRERDARREALISAAVREGWIAGDEAAARRAYYRLQSADDAWDRATTYLHNAVLDGHVTERDAERRTDLLQQLLQRFVDEDRGQSQLDTQETQLLPAYRADTASESPARVRAWREYERGMRPYRDRQTHL